MARKTNASDDVADDTLRPEEIDGLEALETIESALRGAVRGIRAKVRPNVDAETPTLLESVASDRPVTAAAVAAATGFALGLVVRRVIPWRLK